MKSAFKYKLVVLSLIFSGCTASTEMAAFRDPEYRNSTFRYIVVEAHTSDLKWRKKIESRLTERLNKIGIDATESSTIFPPTKELTVKEKAELLHQQFPLPGDKNNMHGWLHIFVGNTGVEKQVALSGQTINTFEKPWSNMETVLIDIRHGKKVWRADSFTGGNALATFDDIINSFCSTTVKALLRGGLIEKSR